jgi:hypothetical protein
MASPALGKLVKQRSDQVRLVFKHYPLSSHEHAEGAARAAVAAGTQGKFWELHDAMFANPQQLDDKGLEQLAKQAGLDLLQFKTDMKSEAVADAVAADRKQAEKLGLRGTPMVYINGRYFDLEKFDLTEDLEPWIQLEVELRSGSAAPVKAAPAAAASGVSPVQGSSSAQGDSAQGKDPKAPKDAPAAATVRGHGQPVGQGG